MRVASIVIRNASSAIISLVSNMINLNNKSQKINKIYQNQPEFFKFQILLMPDWTNSSMKVEQSF